VFREKPKVTEQNELDRDKGSVNTLFFTS